MTLQNCYKRLELAKASGDKEEILIWSDRVVMRGGELPKEPKQDDSKPKPKEKVKKSDYQ